MEAAAELVQYQKLKLWEPRMESAEEEEEEGEEETSEPLVFYVSRPQDSPWNKTGGLPGAWARLVAAVLLLAMGCALAVRQLQGRGSSAGSLGSGAPPSRRHSHHAGEYHHGAIISQAVTCSHLGQQLLVAGGNVVDAGVAAALCLAVVHPHATGLGAMFWGLFYNSSSGNSTALTPGPAQPLAPGLELPTALPALHLLHAHFGHLPWPRLLMDPARLAQDGFMVDAPLAKALAAHGTKGLCPFFCHADETPLGLGARASNPKLATVLHRAALASTPDLAGDALLSLLARDLGLEEPAAGPTPTLEPALQLAMPEGILFTTPAPSAGPELLALVKAAPHPSEPSPSPCPQPSQTAGTPVSSTLATVDSSGSVLLLASSLNSSFGSGRLSPNTGVLLSDLVARSATSPWAGPLILRGSLDDPETDVLGLVASGAPKTSTTMAHALLSHLAGPQTQTQHRHQNQQGPTGKPRICGQGTLLQVAAYAEHAHVSSVPRGCCPFEGF